MEDEEHIKAVLAGSAEVNLPPAATTYFINFAIESGWDCEEYGLQIEFLLATALEDKGRSKKVYRQELPELRLCGNPSATAGAAVGSGEAKPYVGGQHARSGAFSAWNSAR